MNETEQAADKVLIQAPEMTNDPPPMLVNLLERLAAIEGQIEALQTAQNQANEVISVQSKAINSLAATVRDMQENGGAHVSDRGDPEGTGQTGD